MGKPIPNTRRQRAYDAAKSIGVKDPHSLVSGMAEQLERDKPFEAMEVAKKHIDSLAMGVLRCCSLV